MTWQKALPVITSIGIILLVAALRDRSRVVAAIIATMPINVPLALWVVASGSNQDVLVTVDFMRSVLISLIPSTAWLVIVFLAIRAGWSLWLAIGAGYGMWVVLIAAMFWLGWLTWPK